MHANTVTIDYFASDLFNVIVWKNMANTIQCFFIISNEIQSKVLHMEKRERNLPSAASLHIFRTLRAVPGESYRPFPRFGAFLNLIVPFFVQFSSVQLSIQIMTFFCV